MNSEGREDIETKNTKLYASTKKRAREIVHLKAIMISLLVANMQVARTNPNLKYNFDSDISN